MRSLKIKAFMKKQLLALAIIFLIGTTTASAQSNV
jgi:hypothetical protein